MAGEIQNRFQMKIYRKRQRRKKLILKNQMMRKNGKMKFLRRNPKNIIFLVERKSLLRKKKVE